MGTHFYPAIEWTLEMMKNEGSGVEFGKPHSLAVNVIHFYFLNKIIKVERSKKELKKSGVCQSPNQSPQSTQLATSLKAVECTRSTPLLAI